MRCKDAHLFEIKRMIKYMKSKNAVKIFNSILTGVPTAKPSMKGGRVNFAAFLDIF